MCCLPWVGKHFLPIKYEYNTFSVRHGKPFVQNVKSKHMSMAQCYIRNVAKLCLWESIIKGSLKVAKGSEATCCWCQLENEKRPCLSLEVGMNKLLTTTNSGVDLRKGEAFQWNQALLVKANTTLSLSFWRMCAGINVYKIPYVFLIVPSDHKSALTESLVPGTKLWNHLGQGLKAAEATANVTYDTKNMVFQMTLSKRYF